MLRFISTLLLGLSILWIAACTSTPKKPATTALPLDQVQKLKNMQFKSSAPIPVHDVKAKQ